MARKVEAPGRVAPGVAAGGCADASIYRRFHRAGLTQLTMFPYLVPVTKEDPRSALFEQQHVTALDPEEAVAIAVEFRDSSWLPGHGDEVLSFLAQHDLTYVSVDAPRVRAQIPSIVALTSSIAVVRLHGRNAQGFLRQLRSEAPTVAEKYGYFYTEDELREIVGKARALDGHAERVYLKLNNNREDFPALNGIQIKELLGLETPERTAVEDEWSRRRRATRWSR